MMDRKHAFVPFAAAIVAFTQGAPAAGRAADVSSPAYGSLHWRYVGPARGGRTQAVTGIPNDPFSYYIAAVNGGIWKSDDAGRTWQPIFDGQPTGSIGSLAVAPSNPKILYAGSGEGLQRPDLSIGDGVYKSTDGGATWTNVGLRNGQQIPGIAVDPTDPNRLFVAVLGHPYGPNDERGVYRSLDGGTTWQRVLFKNENVGAFAVAIDPNDRNVVYATLWAARQAPWEIGASFEIAGSGLFKSSDGGTTWSQLTQGLPSRVGRTEVAVAPSDSHIVYAYADAELKGDEGGALYRSDDAGAHFAKVNGRANIAQRGDDLVSIAVDPRDPNTIYLTNTSTYRSSDGGKTFVAIKGAPGGDDYHSVWINPSDPKVVILGSDQGATISLNGGRTWSSWYNQPTAQMFHVFATAEFPYQLCGGQQESGSACVSSRGNWGQVTQRDWHPVGAFEYGYVVEDPLHPGTFFGAKVEKFQERTGQTQEVGPLVLRTKGYRAVRTEPLIFDRFDKHRLYSGANVVFATEDGGQHWRQISPDLTRAHPAVPGVIRAFESDDPQAGGHRGVVYALAPSYRRPGTLWAGTDDGLVWITRDGGSHWKNITPPALTPWSKIAQIDASRYDDDTAFVAVTRFRLDDLRPYVYVTHDGGAHWRLTVDGLPDWPVNAVRQDPVEPRLLYAATENGVAVSFDEGAHWQSLQNNLPRTSVRDAVVAGDDLDVATHGRGFWILDDVEPLRELARGTVSGVHLFAPSAAYRVHWNTNTDTPLPPEEPTGQNPPDGAILDYSLAAPAQKVTISVYDARGSLVRRFSSDDVPPEPIPDLDKPAYWERGFARPSTAAGAHRFVWNLREADPKGSPQDLPISAVPHDTPPVPQGVLVLPGRYLVRLQADGTTVERPLTVLLDPRVTIGTGALRDQYDLARRVAASIDRSFDDAAAARGAHQSKDAAAFDDLNGQFTTLLFVVDDADAPPTAQAVRAASTLESRLQEAERTYRTHLPHKE
ncbi:MAG: glycoside hydrolase [Candidatus Eremiobacteraeota bacterium]|nr:glycoside hydrolase [Candidatus Eremiobacteraeota bacterium]